MALSSSVGRGGRNLPADVGLVQNLLNRHLSPIGHPALILDNACGPSTIAAICVFQLRILRHAHQDGRVDPNGATLKALSGAVRVSIGQPSANLSGSAWWHANQQKYKNSSDVEDLQVAFRKLVKEFLAALDLAGAMVSISATLRHPVRAYLMRYSWDIAKGLIAPSAVPLRPDCNIVWIHDTPTKSIHAAQQMLSLFGIVFRPSLTSRHIQGLAIDMDISWTGTLKIKNKQNVLLSIGAPNSGADNTELHAVGSTYGVKKLLSDAPHWSSDGH